jgi:prepilin-type N-terminal cleavage/methylation domain-containing protein
MNSKAYPTTNYSPSLRGFTLAELMVVVGIFAILAAIAIPSYQSYIQKARVAHAVADIMTIATVIGRYNTLNNSLPPDLATIASTTSSIRGGSPTFTFPSPASKEKARCERTRIWCRSTRNMIFTASARTDSPNLPSRFLSARTM